jgi:hypothetical protein
LQSTSWMPASSRICTGGATGDHTGTGAAGLQQHPTGTQNTDHGVGDRRAGERHGEEVLASLLGALLDGEGHLLRLAVAETDPAGAVTDHHEGGEGEPTAALDHLGHAVDVDDPRLAQLQVGFVCSVPSELQSCFASGLCDCRDSTVVAVSATIEHHCGHAGGLGPLGDELADLGGAFTLPPVDRRLARASRRPPGCGPWNRR